jgi:hypothetical protein
VKEEEKTDYEKLLDLYRAAAEECRRGRRVSKYTAVAWTEAQTKHNEERDKLGMDPL